MNIHKILHNHLNNTQNISLAKSLSFTRKVASLKNRVIFPVSIEVIFLPKVGALTLYNYNGTNTIFLTHINVSDNIKASHTDSVTYQRTHLHML